jgi:hypothetical protein
MTRRSIAVVALVLAVASCGDDAPLAERAELQGFAVADVEDLIERNDTAYDSSAHELRFLQQFAKGWAACRDAYEGYASFVQGGGVPPRPDVRSAEADVPGTDQEIQTFIAELWSPIADGDAEGTRAQLVDDQVCGFIPAQESGDRSVTIAEAVEELSG